ncbi:MAG: helix-turn-helix transcriptional regulator [Lachnospiraceae bacterium]|nr:helix-turn-helix transcriptional regulator [Lachnospiraceae bacterium]
MKLDKKKVQLRMAKLGLNQSQFAERAEISRQTISYVMNGRRCRPELLGKIAKALEVDPVEIIED